jgi:small subunit ribosomal protein S17
MEQTASRDRGEKDGVESPAKPHHRNEKVGVVVSDKMQKTVVVAVERLVRHPLYEKRIRRTSTFMAHDEKGAQRGDTVRIVETRPLSKRKRWRVAEVVKKGPGVDLLAVDLPDAATE